MTSNGNLYNRFRLLMLNCNQINIFLYSRKVLLKICCISISEIKAEFSNKKLIIILAYLEMNVFDLNEAIVKIFSPERIIIFGSYASGYPSKDNDLDILIVMHTDIPQHKRATPIRLLFHPTPCAMDILVYTPKEVAEWNGTTNHVITEAFQNGRVVYEQKA